MDWDELDDGVEDWEYPEPDDEMEGSSPECPECGAEVYDDVAICPQCGCAISAADHRSAQGIWRLTAVAILICIAIGVLATLFR